MQTPFDVELAAGEKTYTLRFNFGAICALENRLNKGFNAIAAEMQDVASMRLSTLREMVFAGLKMHHPKITLDEAGEVILAAGGIVVAVQKVAEAIVAAFPQQPAEVADGAARPTSAPGEAIGSTH